MIPKKTKEQLIAEVAKLQIINKSILDNDERLRREFAKAFGWSKNTMFGCVIENPSWEQVFVQVGKLLVLEDLKKKVIPSSPIL